MIRFFSRPFQIFHRFVAIFMLMHRCRYFCASFRFKAPDTHIPHRVCSVRLRSFVVAIPCLSNVHKYFMNCQYLSTVNVHTRACILHQISNNNNICKISSAKVLDYVKINVFFIFVLVSKMKNMFLRIFCSGAQ